MYVLSVIGGVSDPVYFLMKCIFLFCISHANLIVNVGPLNRLRRGPEGTTAYLGRFPTWLCWRAHMAHTAALTNGVGNTNVYTEACWFQLQGDLAGRQADGRISTRAWLLPGHTA